MIDRMTKYSFILLSGKNEEFLKELQGLGLVDITRSSKPVDSRSADMLARSEQIQKAISAIKDVDWSKDPEKERIEAAASSAGKSSNPFEDWKEASSQLTSLNAELIQAQKDAESARVWGSFDADALKKLEELGYKTRFYKIAKKRFDPSWAALYPLQEVADNGKEVWFVTVSDDQEYSLPVDECQAPTGDLETALKNVASLKDMIVLCKGRMLSLKECIQDLEKENASVSAELQRYLADADSGKAAEDMITTFVGFAPTDNDEQLCKAFDGMDVIYLKEAAVTEDNPPIKFKENKLVKLFTVLTDMYGRPGYDEFDPTPYITIFFTLFFAMCMGDAGYGLILLAVGLGLKKKLGDIAPLVTVLGGATFLMGIVLHTFFGTDLSAAAWVPGWMKKCMISGEVAGYDAQMLFAIGLGVLHICVAMVIKAVYSVKRNGFLESLGTLGWTLLIVGGVIIGGAALLGVIDSTITKWIVIILGSISAVGIFLLNDVHRNPLLNIGSGLYETYNTATGLLGDVLSYIRLYALGLAGGMLGNAFNELATSLLGIGIPGLNFILFGLLVLVGHALNIAMSCLGAFVHPLRLNFLEFFKNSGYEGAGRAYSPLETKEQ